MDTDEHGSASHTPLLMAVAEPGHWLYAPLRAWGVNIMVAGIAGVVIGPLVGPGPSPEILMAVFVTLHIYVAIRYRRDPHVVALWEVYWSSGRPWPPYSRRRGRTLLSRHLDRGRRVVRFS